MCKVMPTVASLAEITVLRAMSAAWVAQMCCSLETSVRLNSCQFQVTRLWMVRNYSDPLSIFQCSSWSFNWTWAMTKKNIQCCVLTSSYSQTDQKHFFSSQNESVCLYMFSEYLYICKIKIFSHSSMPLLLLIIISVLRMKNYLKPITDLKKISRDI